MFGIGLPEMIVIFAVALIVVGPDKLPGLARSLAKGMAEMKRTLHQVKDSLTQEGEVIDSVQKELKTTAEELRAKMTDAGPEVWQLPDGEGQEVQGEKGVLDLEPVSTYPEVAAHPLDAAVDSGKSSTDSGADEAPVHAAPSDIEVEASKAPPAPSTDTDSGAEPSPPRAA